MTSGMALKRFRSIVTLKRGNKKQNKNKNKNGYHNGKRFTTGKIEKEYSSLATAMKFIG